MSGAGLGFLVFTLLVKLGESQVGHHSSLFGFWVEGVRLMAGLGLLIRLTRLVAILQPAHKSDAASSSLASCGLSFQRFTASMLSSSTNGEAPPDHCKSGVGMVLRLRGSAGSASSLSKASAPLNSTSLKFLRPKGAAMAPEAK